MGKSTRLKAAAIDPENVRAAAAGLRMPKPPEPSNDRERAELEKKSAAERAVDAAQKVRAMLSNTQHGRRARPATSSPHHPAPRPSLQVHDLLNEQNDRREATESFVRGTAATLKRLLKAGGAVDTALEDELLGVAPPPPAAGAEGLPPTPSKVRRNKTGLGYDGGASAGGGGKEEDEEEEPVDMQTQMAMMMSMMTSGGGGGGGADAPAIVGPVSSASALKKDKLNLSGLLNVLDGVVDTPGRIVVMTTNHPEILDPALIRPGRIDQKLLLGYMNARNVIEMMKHYFQVGRPPP